MTAGRGRRYAGPDASTRRSERVVAALRAAGPDPRATEPYTHTVPVSATARASASSRSSRCSGSCAWTSWPRRRSRPCATGACRSTRASQSRRYLDWLENIRPWCISRQLWWGHQLPVWYRGDETYVGTEPPEGEGWERDPDVLDTWFSSALWPFATLGWPEETPELRAFYPTDVLSTARDILFLWVARMVMMGLEFTGDIPFDARLRALGHPGARRPADEQVAGHRHRPARRDRAATAPTRCASACWRCPRPRTCASARRRSRRASALANKLFNAVAVRAAQRRRTSRPAPRPRTVEDRWILSRLQAREGRRARRDRGASTSPRPRSASTTSSTASCATGTSSSSRAASSTTDLSGDAAARAARDARARAPGDPVRDRGAVGATCPAPRACSRGARRRGPTRRCATRRPRPRSAHVIEAVQALRALARRRRRQARRACCPRRVDGLDGAARRSSPGWRGWTSTATREPSRRRVPIPGGSVEICAATASTGEAEAAQARGRARARCSARSRAPRASWPTRASSPRRPPAVVQAERDKLERLRARAGGADVARA